MNLADIELYPVSLHWLPDADPYSDLCIHGGIYLRLGERVVADGENTDWSISTAAFRLLRTITNDHDRSVDDALIPHCGFSFFVSETATDGLMMPNCNEGIDWVVHHIRDDQIEHLFGDNEKIFTDLDEWSRQVCNFSDQVFDFYQTAWPKIVSDEEDRKGFELFMRLWEKRRRIAEGQ